MIGLWQIRTNQEIIEAERMNNLSYHDGCLHYKISLMSCKNAVLLKVKKSDWSGTSCIELEQFSRAKFHENNWQLNGQILDPNLSAHSMIMCFSYIHHLKELQPQHHRKCFLKNILEAFQDRQKPNPCKTFCKWVKMSWVLDYVQESGKKKYRYSTCNLKPF